MVLVLVLPPCVDYTWGVKDLFLRMRGTGYQVKGVLGLGVPPPMGKNACRGPWFAWDGMRHPMSGPPAKSFVVSMVGEAYYARV